MDRQKRSIDATASRAGHYTHSEQLYICRLVLLEFFALGRMLIIHIYGRITVIYYIMLVYDDIW
jgi:hypothetical protein